VAWQLALSFVLRIMRAAPISSFENLRRVDAGFRTENVVTATLSLNFSKYTTAEHRLDVDRTNAFYRNIEDRLRAVPGVALLDQTMDPDHHRAVLTFAGAPEAVAEAAFHAAKTAAAHIDLRTHQGAHPRVGARAGPAP